MCRSEKVMAIEFSGDVRERKKERERKREKGVGTQELNHQKGRDFETPKKVVFIATQETLEVLGISS